MTDDPTDGRTGTGTETPTEDHETDGGRLRPTRRRVLQGTAAATVAGGFGGISLAQDDDGEAISPDQEIVLGGRVEAWEGREPEAIADQENPTLNLEPGATYDLTWENVDGLPHNVVLLDAEESVIERTEIISEQGATQTLTFTAAEEMTTYLCEVHPTSMRGQMQVGGADEQEQAGAAIADVETGAEVGLQRVAGGDPLNQPVGFQTVTVDGAERQFVVDQTGEIYLVTEDGLSPFLDITERLLIRNEGFDERGLLGLAFHPNFQQNRRFYVRYSSYPRDRDLPEAYDHMFLLSEFQANEAFTEADPDSERVLLEVPEPQFNHNAGDIAFGPDGMLYVPTGDGGGANDVGIGHVNDWYEQNRGGNGQDVTENLLGSILRIDVDAREGDMPYGVPGDNPLVDREGLDEQWAWGFRNPWRMSWNEGTLVVADVGQNLWEEIDVVEAGGNYGWNVREGSHCFSAENPAQPEAITACPTDAPDEEPYDGQPLEDPVLEYPHTLDGAAVGVSVTGGYVYYGDQIPELSGRYVFGDWSASGAQPRGRLWVADVPGVEADGQAGADGTGADEETATGNETDDGTETENVTVEDGADEGNVTGDNETEMFNETDANETAGEAVDNVTVEVGTDEGNVTVGNESAGGEADNVTVGNETADGEADNVTAGNATDNETAPREVENVGVNETEDGAAQGPAADLPMQEIAIANAPNGEISRTVLAFGRDDAGEVYVCTSNTTTIDGTGDVFRIVPPEEGEEIQPPEGQEDGQDGN